MSAAQGKRILDEDESDSGRAGSSFKMPSQGTAAPSKRRVSYFYDPEIGSKCSHAQLCKIFSAGRSDRFTPRLISAFLHLIADWHYGQGHPMKVSRLVFNLGVELPACMLHNVGFLLHALKSRVSIRTRLHACSLRSPTGFEWRITLLSAMIFTDRWKYS